MVFPAVHRGLDLFHIALADQAADLISGIGVAKRWNTLW